PNSYGYGMYVYYSDGTSTERGIIANNFISIIGGSSTNYGIYDYNSTYQDFYYNSVSINAGNTSSRSLYLSSGSNQKFINNIFSNTGGGYCAYFNTPTAVLVSDYNNFYKPASSTSSYYVYWSGNKTTLAALQTASGKDSHSVNIDPTFTSNTDLHLSTTVLSGLGTPLTAVTVDIDGTPRSQLPTIGADEMPLIPIDAGVSNVIAPLANAIVNEGASIPVTIQVMNYGTDTIFGMNIQYSVNNGTPVIVAYNDTLLSSATDIVTMPNFNATAGNSNICAKTVLIGDTNYFNDEYCQPFFGTPAKDAYVTRILKIEEGCGLGLDTVKIMIRNIGVDTINGPTATTMTAHYQLDGISTIINENMTLTINPGDSALFTFSTLANFAVTALDSIFDVAAWVNLTGDNVSYNDTAYIEVESLHTPLDPIVTSPVTVPYASPASVSATSPTNDPLTWFADDTTSVILTTGPNYTTPLMYNADTLYVQAGLIFSGSGNVNIAPAAVASASTCNTGPCTTLNDLNFGSCGSQQMWISTSSPPSSTPGVNYMDFTWPTARSFNKMTIHHAQNNARSLTGALMQKWDGSSWVSFHTFSNLPQACINDVNFPVVTTTRLRLTSFQMTGSGQTSNPNFREIEIFEALVGCASNRVPLIINVSAPSSCDVGVFRITQPVSSINLSSAETVSVKVKNYGTVAQTNIPVSYQVGSGTIVTETITSSILPGDSLTHTFVTPANIGAIGTIYQFKAWTALSCDTVQVNDTIWKSVQNIIPTYCPSNATSTSYHDIENVTVGGINNTSPSPFTATYTNYTSLAPAMIAPGNSYAVSVKVTSTSSSSYNGFVEIYIDYNRDGVYNEATETAVGMAYSAASSSAPATVTGTIVVPIGALNGFSQMRVVARMQGTAANVHPCGTYSYGETEDYSVMIAPLIANDAGVIDIIQPSTIAATATTPIEVIVVNYGTDSINSVLVSYELNAGTPVTQTYTGLMLTGDSVNIVFPAVTLPMGQNSICAYTTLANDSNTFNDQKCINSYVQYATTAPYFDNFEGTDYWLPDTLLNQWERGIPSATNINSAHSPTKVWMIDLNSTYANNSFDYLYTPQFNFAAVTPDSIKFWHYYNTQSNNDGGRVQYLNVSGYWINMGSQNDPNGTNWYNTFNGVPFWSGNSNGWVESSYLLSAVTGMTNPAQFRFVFQSNASSNSFDGWAIDDFEITIPTMANDPGVTAIVSPTDSTQIGSAISVEITIKNHGSNTLLTIPVHYKAGNNATVNETWSGTLIPGSTVNYTFTTTFPSPGNNYSLCAWATGINPTYTFNDSICKNIIATAAAYDVGICKIEVPVDTLKCEVKVWIKNYGTNSVSSVDVFYHLNGMNEVTDIWTGTLNPNDSVQFTFPGQAVAPIGMFNFCAGTDYTGDMNHSNDSLCKSVVGDKCDIGFADINMNGFILKQNIPNPTTGITQVGYTVPTSGTIRFDLMNVLGQSMITQEKTVMAGSHTIELFVGNLPAGVYYYSVIFEGRRLVKKMVI
ncbi:MAG: T9SS type A sorting domain-containing protein, partial [Bacteroidetes bacterium]|nr:T9SS type A sorting domain-containing protein [Bacteroidota bacterium]